MMHSTVRARLTAGVAGLRRPVLRAAAASLWLALAAAALAGCGGPQAGGQSGTEGCLPESTSDTRILATADEDGGSDDADVPDGGTAFVASDQANPESETAPRQCVVPGR